MTDVFISYSRKDFVFAERLVDALKAQGRDTWIDWASINHAEDFWQAIQNGIASADNFVFLISPDSLTSSICNDELAYARANKKRIIPIVRREPDIKQIEVKWSGQTWEQIARENWLEIKKLDFIFFRKRTGFDCEFDITTKKVLNPECDGVDSDADNFESAFASLIDTVKRDPIYTKNHTDFLLAARAWINAGRSPGFILRNERLVEAEQWLNLANSERKDPQPTEDHRVFIAASRKAENIRQVNQRNSILAAIGLIILVVLLGIASFVLFGQATNASNQVSTADVAKGQAVDAQQTAVAQVVTATFAQGVAIYAKNTSLAQVATATYQVGTADAQVIIATRTLAAVSTSIQQQSERSESLRFLNLVNDIFLESNPNYEVAALLGIRALKIPNYAPQAIKKIYSVLPFLDTVIPLYNIGGRVVLDAEFTSDSKKIFAFATDGNALIFDLNSQKIVDFGTQSDSLIFAVFSPNGQSILTGSVDGKATIWNLEGKELVHLVGHSSTEYPTSSGKPIRFGIMAGTFSPDGSNVVTAGGDGTVRIWDAATGKEITLLKGHTGPVFDVTYSQDGTRILTAGYDRTARVWDVSSGIELFSPLRHEDLITEAKFNGKGTRIVTASADGTARLWDANTGTLVFEMKGHLSKVNHALFSPNDKFIATAGEDATVRLWDAESGNLLFLLNGHRFLTGNPFPLTLDKSAYIYMPSAGGVQYIEFSSDSTKLITASNDATARIWNVQSGTQITVLSGHRAGIYTAHFNRNADKVVTASSDGTIRLWNIPLNSADKINGFDGRVFDDSTATLQNALLSQDGHELSITSNDGIVRIYNTETSKLIRSLQGHRGAVYSAVFSFDDKMIVTAGQDRTVRIWDIATGTILCSLTGHSDEVYGAEFSYDNTLVASASFDKSVRIWDVRTCTLVKVLIGHKAHVNNARFSEDGQLIVSASDDGTARIWDVATGKTLFILDTKQALENASFDYLGKRIVTSGSAGRVIVWDAQTGSPITTLVGHSQIVWNAKFSPDGNSIVTLGQDGTARLWNTNTGAEIENFPLTTGFEGVDIIFNLGGGGFTTTSVRNNVAHLENWIISPNQLIDYICKHIFRDFTNQERQSYGITDTTPTCDHFGS